MNIYYRKQTMTVLNDKEIEVLKGLRALNLQGFATTLEQQFENPKVFLKLTVDERIQACINAQNIYNKEQRYASLKRSAKLTKNFSIGSLDMTRYSTIPAGVLADLSAGNWLHRTDNIIIAGQSGAGKTALACALGNLACQFGYKTLMVRTDELLTKLKAMSPQEQIRYFMRLDKIHVLILDDFLVLNRCDDEDIKLLYRLTDGRDAKVPTIYVTQFKKEGIIEALQSSLCADGLKDRIVGPAHFIEVTGHHYHP